MFETFSVPSMYLSDTSLLCLLASGRTTGAVVEIGHEVCQSVPIFDKVEFVSSMTGKSKNYSFFECSTLRYCIQRSKVAGKEITEHLVNLLCERGYEMTTTAEREIVRDIKEKLCYVSCKEYSNGRNCEREYELPDGSTMTIGYERFQAPEIMFNASARFQDQPGLHELVFNSIEKLNDIPELRKEMYQNIVLGGGSSMFEGIVERLTDEIEKLLSKKEVSGKKTKIKVNAPAERKFSVWIGGSILSSLSSFKKCYLTKQEYEEFGDEKSDVILKKGSSPSISDEKYIKRNILEFLEDEKNRNEYLQNQMLEEEDHQYLGMMKIQLGRYGILNVFKSFLC